MNELLSVWVVRANPKFDYPIRKLFTLYIYDAKGPKPPYDISV